MCRSHLDGVRFLSDMTALTLEEPSFIFITTVLEIVVAGQYADRCSLQLDTWRRAKRGRARPSSLGISLLVPHLDAFALHLKYRKIVCVLQCGSWFSFYCRLSLSLSPFPCVFSLPFLLPLPPCVFSLSLFDFRSTQFCRYQVTISRKVQISLISSNVNC